MAETEYQPTACHKPYRLIALRKNLSVERGQKVLFEDYRYFLYLTNDWETPEEELVLLANGRCNHVPFAEILSRLST